jgi:NAD(P)-dependent dehydrogenase (short-subunit alcohol dehydrogenase family)
LPQRDIETVNAPRQPYDRFDLTGRVALITGGTRGLGRAIIHTLAHAGADIVVSSRKQDACDEAAVEARSIGRRALAHACHVGHWEELEGLVDAAYAEFGRLDILVNNAGISPTYPDPQSVTEELWDKVIAVNLKGPFRLTALVGARMAEGDGGSIINISTAGSWRPDVHDLPYAMAKAGLNAMAVGMAGVWAPKVRVNVVLPGAVDTDITKAWGEQAKQYAADINPMGRIGTPDDYVGICVFLASGASAYINGAQILADGGLFRTL